MVSFQTVAEDLEKFLPEWKPRSELEKDLSSRMIDLKGERIMELESVQIKNIWRRGSAAFVDLLSGNVTNIELVVMEHGKRLDYQCWLETDKGAQGSILIHNCKRWDEKSQVWVADKTRELTYSKRRPDPAKKSYFDKFLNEDKPGDVQQHDNKYRKETAPNRIAQ